MSRRRRLVLTDIAEHFNLLLPAIAGFAMYCIVATNIRYVGSFFTLMWLGIFSSIRLPDSDESKRLLRNVAVVMVLMMMIIMTRHYIRLGPSTPNVQWQIANALQQAGIVPEDRIASIGNSHAHFWARLARVRIVAEIPHNNADNFWNADDLTTSRVLETFRNTGAKAIVTNLVPGNIPPSGWQQLAGTDHFVYMLHN
jgi:membrane-associated protease RseP (regulator of RpoE activity)